MQDSGGKKPKKIWRTVLSKLTKQQPTQLVAKDGANVIGRNRPLRGKKNREKNGRGRGNRVFGTGEPGRGILNSFGLV